MPGFLRRKATDTKVGVAQAQPPTKPVFLESTMSSSGQLGNSPSSPPLYARFASTPSTTVTTTRPVVSGPMMLGNRTRVQSQEGSQEVNYRRQSAQVRQSNYIPLGETRVPTSYSVPQQHGRSQNEMSSANRPTSPPVHLNNRGPPVQILPPNQSTSPNGYVAAAAPTTTTQPANNRRISQVAKREDKPLPKINPDFSSSAPPANANANSRAGPHPHPPPSSFSPSSQSQSQSQSPVQVVNTNGASISNSVQPHRSASHRIPQPEIPLKQQQQQQQGRRFSFMGRANTNNNNNSSVIASPPQPSIPQQQQQANSGYNAFNARPAQAQSRRLSKVQQKPQPPAPPMKAASPVLTQQNEPMSTNLTHHQTPNPPMQGVPSRTQMRSPQPPPPANNGFNSPPPQALTRSSSKSQLQTDSPYPQFVANGQQRPTVMMNGNGQLGPAQQQAQSSSNYVRRASIVPGLPPNGRAQHQHQHQQVPTGQPYPPEPRLNDRSSTGLRLVSQSSLSPPPTSNTPPNVPNVPVSRPPPPPAKTGIEKRKPLIFAAMASVDNSNVPQTPPPPTLNEYLHGLNRAPSTNESHTSRTPTMSTQQLPHPVPLPKIPSPAPPSPPSKQQQQQQQLKKAPSPQPPSSPPQQQQHLKNKSSLNFNLFQTAPRPSTPKSSAQATDRPRKMSKSSMRSLSQTSRNSGDVASMISHAHSLSAGSSSTNELASSSSNSTRLAKHRPTTPRPTTPSKARSAADTIMEPPPSLDEEVQRNAGLPLDDDPFAKAEPVQLIRSHSRDGLSSVGNPVTPDLLPNPVTPPRIKAHSPQPAPSPEEYKSARSKRRGDKLGKAAPPDMTGIVPREDKVPGPFPLDVFLSYPVLLENLLNYLSYYEWRVLLSVSKQMGVGLGQRDELREVVLERYLKMVGYARWSWAGRDPLTLTLKDLNDYMRGVSMPTFQYAQIAHRSTSGSASNIDLANREALTDSMISATASTRAYTRVVLRLRVQAETELEDVNIKRQRLPQNGHGISSPPPVTRGLYSRPPSPTTSSYSHSHHDLGGRSSPLPPSSSSSYPHATFRSPLFRPRRAPLLRVFVPSPEGDWLSDASVLHCEEELKRAGVQGLMRIGDVVWDVAVGDEGNVGRMIWDGSYLIDLDYTYSTAGDLPKYLHALSFPPSYFHRVLRTGTNSNPIVHVDISPWGSEIAANLQLLQDRVRTETPQGAYHNVVRWVHRSSFTIRVPPPKPRQNGSYPPPSRVQIAGAPPGTFVDPGWYGTIVVETEGTNEHLADLQDRCGPGSFPPRVDPPGKVRTKDKGSLKVFRILREKSRPGEIWIRTVSEKERIN